MQKKQANARCIFLHKFFKLLDLVWVFLEKFLPLVSAKLLHMTSDPLVKKSRKLYIKNESTEYRKILSKKWTCCQRKKKQPKLQKPSAGSQCKAVYTLTFTSGNEGRGIH